jgi:hypothetical protein
VEEEKEEGEGEDEKEGWLKRSTASCDPIFTNVRRRYLSQTLKGVRTLVPSLSLSNLYLILKQGLFLPYFSSVLTGGTPMS